MIDEEEDYEDLMAWREAMHDHKGESGLDWDDDALGDECDDAFEEEPDDASEEDLVHLIDAYLREHPVERDGE